MISLRAEHRAACSAIGRLTHEKRRKFWDYVGHPGKRLDIGGIGLAMVQTDNSGFYEPTEKGAWAVIIPVRDLPHTLGGEIYDLLAVMPKTGKFFHRIGSADILGDWWTAPPVWERVPIWATPIEWVKANGNGIAVLDWSQAWGAIGHMVELTTDDQALRKRLLETLKPRSLTGPKIRAALTPVHP